MLCMPSCRFRARRQIHRISRNCRRCHQVGVAADKAVVADGGAAFDLAVIVDHHHAAAEIAVFSHVGVADVGQVGHRGPLADGGIFDLDKVADVHVFADDAVRPQLHPRADGGPVANAALAALAGVESDVFACLLYTSSPLREATAWFSSLTYMS